MAETAEVYGEDVGEDVPNATYDRAPSGKTTKVAYSHRRMGTLWLGGAEGLICPKFYTDNHKHPPPLGHCPRDVIHPPKISKTPLLLDIHKPPLGHCLRDVIIHIPKGLICSFLWPIFSSCFARISPTVCPNFTHCLPEFHPLFARIWGAAAPPAPPASYAYAYSVVFCAFTPTTSRPTSTV